MINDIDIRNQQQRYNDKLSETSAAYWAAELTVNGIIIALFSLDILESNQDFKYLAFSVITLAIISISLLLLNFRRVRDLYFNLGKMGIDDFWEMSKVDKEKEKNKNIRSFKYRKFREWTVDIFLIVEILSILFIAIHKTFLQC